MSFWSTARDRPPSKWISYTEPPLWDSSTKVVFSSLWTREPRVKLCYFYWVKRTSSVHLYFASSLSGGQYIGSGRVRKILEINQFLLGTMAGGAADCVFWERVLSRECRLFELRNKERISVAAASKILNNICYRYKVPSYIFTSYCPVLIRVICRAWVSPWES